MSKPKEFYIHPGKGICFEAGKREIKTSGFIHVIEHSTYLDAAAIHIERLKELGEQITLIKKLREEIDETEELFERAMKRRDKAEAAECAEYNREIRLLEEENTKLKQQVELFSKELP